MNVIEHYDKLIDENNDPVYDPEPLKEHMNKWDGQVFIDAMKLDKTKTVLEIGLGTGRLALKTIPFCKEFVGIEVEPKNKAQGYKVSADKEQDRVITVIAKGVSSALETLDASKIKAYIDLTGYT